MSLIAGWAWRAYARHRTPGWRARLDEVRRIASLSADAFAAWRREAVAEHLAWARRAVPWFSERLRDGTRLEDLPPLTRADVQANAERLRDATRPVSDLLPEASGGSTGQPVRLWTDRDAQAWTVAADAHVVEGWGLAPWSRTALLWGDDRDRARLPLRARLEERLTDLRVLNAFSMDDARMDAFARECERRPPDLVRGYVRALELFADFLARHPERRVRPRVVQSAAEALSPDARARIEKAFGCPVRDVYGSRESPSLAAECARGRMHVLAHGRVLEIVDADGKPLPPGVPGVVLVTDLRNRAFGLIRYENGDVASWAREERPCACGSPFPVLERIWGRTSDFVTLPSGERVHGEWFTHLFYGVAGVAAFQVRQRSPASLEVLTTGPAGRATLDPILARVRERVGPRVEVLWRAVAEIPLTPSGKRRFTVSDVPFLPGRA